MAIYVTGDTHGGWMRRLNSNAFPEGLELTKDAYVRVLGDFGSCEKSGSDKRRLDWLEKKPWTTLFVDGNHENFDILDNLPVSEWCVGKVHFVRPSVIHLMRGQIFKIDDKTFFTFGGASSHDIDDGILEPGDPRIKEWQKDYKKCFRVNHVSWWERELPSEEELNEGLNNLKKVDNKVDFIVTHSPFTSLLRQMDGGSGLYKADILTDYLQKIRQTVDYKAWLFGHMHVNKKFYWERSICFYEQIARIL